MAQDMEIPKYRIGEFAAYMGVTPDFLKHYEQFDLVSPVTLENGYRYYPFDQSFKILECIRLRNFGFSIRETETLLNKDTLSSVQDKMDRKAEEIERHIEFEEEVLADYRQFSKWLEKLHGQTENWYISDLEEMYFLPHSDAYDFLKDERIYAILHDWMEWMPVVKSCMEIRGCEELSENPHYSWGLCVKESFARKHGLPVNQVIKRIPAQRTLIYIYREMQVGAEIRFDQMQKIYALLKQLGLRPAGNIYNVVFMYTHINDDTRLCGAFLIPL